MASSTPPQVDQEARFRQETREAFDAEVDDISCDQDKLDQLTSIQSFSFHFIKDALRRPAADSEAVQLNLAVLWHMFLGTAEALDKDDVFQDKLVSLLLWTKEFDALHRSLYSTDDAAMTEGWESYGFGKSVQTEFEGLLNAGTVEQRSNLAAFSSKLLAVSNSADSIGLTALWYLRETLEIDDEARTNKLLPTAVVWIDHSRHKLFVSSVKNKPYEEDAIANLAIPGVLARNAGIDHPGFTMDRWLFWRRRFQELSHSTDADLAKVAKKGFMSMINCGRDLDYDVPGEAKFTEKLQAAMWEALVKSGKESLSGDDIEIDVDWVK